jgi:hypothetical protein
VRQKFASSFVADTAGECNIPIVITGRISFAAGAAIQPLPIAAVRFVAQKAEVDQGDRTRRGSVS